MLVVSNLADSSPQSARLRADESQANAELRQAFANHLPRRIELIQKRIHRIVKSAFDINAITVLLQEVQGLAGTAGKHGLMGPGEKMFALERELERVALEAVELSPQRKLALEELSHALSQASKLEVKVVVSTADFTPDVSLLSDKRFSAPPSDFWRRFSTEDIRAANSDDFGFALQAASRDLVIVSADGKTFASAASAIDAAHTQAIVIESMDDFELVGPGPDEATPAFRSAENVLAEQPQALPASDDNIFGDSQGASQPSSPTLTSIEATPIAAASTAPVAAEVEFELDIDMPATRTPELAPPMKSPVMRTQRVFYLAPEHDYFKALCEKLENHQLTVDRLESMEELLDTLSSMTADLLLIDQAYSPQIESIGDFLKTLRQRVSAKMPVLAFADAADLSARIRALRSGVDVLLPTRFSVQEAFDRIKEQLDFDQLVDYRIMIVEDDRSQALFAESVLRKAGMETLAVTDPLRTLEALERFKPDLILMDLYMPGIDGIELTAIIREREEFITTPIVFLSGEQDSDKQFDAIHAGGDDFLAKPIRPKYLISSVSNRARRARMLRARRDSKGRDQESGLFDRVVVIEKLSESLIVEDRATLIGGLILLDIDQSAELRNKIGVIGLDQVIHHAGAQIKSLLRSTESAARFGDGSILILSQERDAPGLFQLAQAARKLLAMHPAQVDALTVHLDVSAGICGFAQELPEAADMIQAVESALLSARNTEFTLRVVRYEPVRVELSPREQLEHAIRQALAEDSFQLMFQPVVSLEGGVEEQYEVLLRLRDRVGTMYGPSEVFSTAERLNLSADIDRWMLARCMAMLDDYRRRGRTTLRLFINQSIASVADPNRLTWLRQSLETRRLDPASICLEFTLSSVMSQLKNAVSFFQGAHAIGVKLTLDHFENSLSALQMLSYLPVDHIKLSERYLQADATQREELRVLIKAARDGRRKVIASRVENAQAAAALWSLGVDYIQGNFVQQPAAELGFDFHTTAM
jgi:diguanylate cyclase (GGDEF)-like protein